MNWMWSILLKDSHVGNLAHDGSAVQWRSFCDVGEPWEFFLHQWLNSLMSSLLNRPLAGGRTTRGEGRRGWAIREVLWSVYLWVLPDSLPGFLAALRWAASAVYSRCCDVLLHFKLEVMDAVSHAWVKSQKPRAKIRNSFIQFFFSVMFPLPPKFD